MNLSKIKLILYTKIHIIPDKVFLKGVYKIHFKKKLNLDNPQTYNEKLQWLKLHDRNPQYTQMVDKYEVKEYIEKIIGKEYVIPTIGIYDKFDDIDFDTLPNKFVMKCTHDSGGLVICQDKEKLDKIKAKRKINKSLRKNYYYCGREWPYKNVKPRILIEKYMEDKETKELRDYKFFCFNGNPKLMFIATERTKHETKFNYYDMDFNLLDIKQAYPKADKNLKKPKNFDKMIELAKKLSKDIPHVRVDFYEVNGKIYFGEFTFYNFSGFVPFKPDKWDKEIGKWLNIKDIERSE